MTPTPIVYAPWREEFLLSPKTEEGCIFCNRIARPDADEEHFVVYRGDTALVMLNLYPYTSGHLLIIPYRHVGELEDLTDDENLESARLMQQAVAVMKRAMQPDGFTLGLNIGRAAGAGIPGHLHWHVVARWTGDSNFLPVLGGARLLSVRVEETYRRLIEHWPRAAL
jgi:ATP adenylyltransferase